MTNYIWIRTQKELIHEYKNAPNKVSFLKYPHRHLFKFKVYLEVFHKDREVEFILFKRFIDEQLNNIKRSKDKSCEMLSDWLAERIRLIYPKRDIKIEVSEDGENGSEIFYDKSQSLNTQLTLKYLQWY